jgi:hypothetical protein
MRLWLISVLGLLVLATPVAAAAGDDTPPWVQQAAQIKTPPYDKDVQAVVLVDESQMIIASDGKQNESYN